MANFNVFYKKVLEYFSGNKNCYRNLFHSDSTVLKSIMGREVTQQESVLAQRAFKKLVEDGLIYDYNGDEWYTISDEGKKCLESGNFGPESENLDAFVKRYTLHPKIQAVAVDLFNNGHYKEAIQSALVEVIDRVKQVSSNPMTADGNEYDGDRLMQKVFGADGSSAPLIKLNDLGNSLDKAEQRGFMQILKGIVGIRDKKAHLNFIQNDPFKAFEYLCLASLLMRLLDDDFVGQYN